MVSDLLLASTISTKLKLLNHFQWKYLYVYQEFCRDWQIWYLTKIFCFEKEGRKKQPMVWVVKSCHQATEINLEKKEKTKFLSVNNRGKSISYFALQFLRVLCKSIISSQSKFSLWWRNKIILLCQIILGSNPEVYLEPCQTSKMLWQLSTSLVVNSFQWLNILAKCSI